MARPTANFVCTECGWTTLKWAGRCGECQQWGTVIEKDAPTRHTAPARVAEGRAARPITDIAPRDESHTPAVDASDRGVVAAERRTFRTFLFFMSGQHRGEYLGMLCTDN